MKKSKKIRNVMICLFVLVIVVSLSYTVNYKIKTQNNFSIALNEEESLGDTYVLCDPNELSPSPETQTKNTTTCEGSITATYTDGRSCGGNSFYNIDCKNTVTASFDNNDDGSSTPTVSIIAGQGFQYGINVKVVRTCTATFNKENWTSTYKNITDELSKTTNASRKAELTNLKEKMLDFVKEYMNYGNDLDTSVSAKISIPDYKTNGEKKTFGVDFEIEKKSGGVGKRTLGGVVDVGLGSDNPYNYTWSNSSNPYIVKLTLPKVYLDKNTGEAKTAVFGSIPDNSIDGGNKLYTDFDADKGIYSVNVELSINDEIITINNNSCRLDIGKVDIVYRPIEITNPFINKKWEKGQNWVNTIYDFTKTIHAGTWNERPLKSIVLTSSEITAIKKSNKDNQSSSPYLGLCDRINRSLQDNITKSLCEQISTIK